MNDDIELKLEQIDCLRYFINHPYSLDIPEVRLKAIDKYNELAEEVNNILTENTC